MNFRNNNIFFVEKVPLHYWFLSKFSIIENKIFATYYEEINCTLANFQNNTLPKWNIKSRGDSRTSKLSRRYFARSSRWMRDVDLDDCDFRVGYLLSVPRGAIGACYTEGNTRSRLSRDSSSAFLRPTDPFLPSVLPSLHFLEVPRCMSRKSAPLMTRRGMLSGSARDHVSSHL